MLKQSILPDMLKHDEAVSYSAIELARIHLVNFEHSNDEVVNITAVSVL